MEWRGRRESTNVVDRRGVKTVGALGGGGLIIAIIYALLGGDPRVILDQVASTPQRVAAPANDDASRFVRVVLADTEDVWHKAFADSGKQYEEPRLVLFTDRVQSACGTASSAMGPFYCPRDSQVYLDLDFFQELSSRLGATGDFAQAYVIAHEVGHHVQNLLGIIDHGQPSVKVELQADCFAGYWAKVTHQMHRSLEPGDLEEALNAASAVGDDTLQRAGQGYVVPDSFTHGSSKQRVAAFNQGFHADSYQGCGTPLAG